MDKERLNKLIKEIDRIGGAGEKRFQDSECPYKGNHPFGFDYLTDEEKSQLHELQLELIKVEKEYYGAPKERVKLKRALRKMVVNFDNDASIEELRFLHEESNKRNTENMFRTELNVEEFAYYEEDNFQGQTLKVQLSMASEFNRKMTEAIEKRNMLDMERWHQHLDEASELFWNSGHVIYVTE